MTVDRKTIGDMIETIPAGVFKRIRKAVDWIVDAKKRERML